MNETVKRTATENPGAFKQYLQELFIASVSNSITETKSQQNLYDVAASWGRTEDEADLDIRRVENMEFAVRIFISKAVDENWEKLILL